MLYLSRNLLKSFIMKTFWQADTSTRTEVLWPRHRSGGNRRFFNLRFPVKDFRNRFFTTGTTGRSFSFADCRSSWPRKRARKTTRTGAGSSSKTRSWMVRNHILWNPLHTVESRYMDHIINCPAWALWNVYEVQCNNPLQWATCYQDQTLRSPCGHYIWTPLYFAWISAPNNIFGTDHHWVFNERPAHYSQELKILTLPRKSQNLQKQSQTLPRKSHVAKISASESWDFAEFFAKNGKICENSPDDQESKNNSEISGAGSRTGSATTFSAVYSETGNV